MVRLPPTEVYAISLTLVGCSPHDLSILRADFSVAKKPPDFLISYADEKKYFFHPHAIHQRFAFQS